VTTDTGTGSPATFPGRDGLELVYHSIGQGRPFVLLHGFTGSGRQLLQHGLASALAAAVPAAYLTALASPELEAAILAFLGEDAAQPPR
jgi:hypothetical protein